MNPSGCRAAAFSILAVQLAALSFAAFPVLAQEVATSPAAGEAAQPAPDVPEPLPNGPILGSQGARRSPTPPVRIPGLNPGQVFKVLAGLGVVLAVVGALAWGARRLLPGIRYGGRLSGLEVLGRIPVGPKHSLVLARFGRRLLVIGAGPEGLSTLCQSEDPAEVEEILLRGGPSSGGFERHMEVREEVDAVAGAQERLRQELTAVRSRLAGLKSVSGAQEPASGGD